MDIIKRILGEADDAGDEQNKKQKKPANAEAHEPESEAEPALDTASHELANLWKTGNREDVAVRFMDMSNEEAVRLVFAIGREGALELARMVDSMMEEQASGEEGGEASTEPARVEPPAEPEGAVPAGGNHVSMRDLIGQPE